jgi:hypothetical protein
VEPTFEAPGVGLESTSSDIMVDEIEVTVTDLQKKHPGKPGYEGMYSIAKHMHQDDGEVLIDGFTIDKENLRILGAKIDAIFIDDDKL